MPSNFIKSNQHRLLIQSAIGSYEEALIAYKKWEKLIEFTDIDYPSQRMLPAVTMNLGYDNVLPEISTAVRFTWFRSQILLTHALKVADLLDDHKIPYMFIKGVAILGHKIRQLEQRPMEDIDFVVPLEYVSAAASVLMKSGYFSDADEMLLTWPSFITVDKHAFAFKNEKGAEIDLHWRIFKKELKRNLNKRIWKRVQEVEIRGTRVKVISQESLLLSILLTINEGNQASWILDASSLVKLNSIKWRSFYFLVYSMGISSFVYEAMTCLNEYSPELLKSRTIKYLRIMVLLEKIRTKPKNFYHNSRRFDEFMRKTNNRGVLFSKQSRSQRSYLQDSDAFLGRIPNYRVGSILEFTNRESRYRLLNAVSGWHESEPHGTWSNGTYSTIIVPLDEPINDSLKLQFSIIPFLCEKFPEQKLEFYIDNVYCNEAKFEGTLGSLTELTLQVPERENRKQFILSIRTYDPHVPLEVGENWDQRELGFFLTSLKVVNSAIEVSLDEQ